jgi:hypothetical protein
MTPCCGMPDMPQIPTKPHETTLYQEFDTAQVQAQVFFNEINSLDLY